MIATIGIAQRIDTTLREFARIDALVVQALFRVPAFVVVSATNCKKFGGEVIQS